MCACCGGGPGPCAREAGAHQLSCVPTVGGAKARAEQAPHPTVCRRASSLLGAPAAWPQADRRHCLARAVSVLLEPQLPRAGAPAGTCASTDIWGPRQGLSSHRGQPGGHGHPCSVVWTWPPLLTRLLGMGDTLRSPAQAGASRSLRGTKPTGGACGWAAAQGGLLGLSQVVEELLGCRSWGHRPVSSRPLGPPVHVAGVCRRRVCWPEGLTTGSSSDLPVFSSVS